MSYFPETGGRPRFVFSGVVPFRSHQLAITQVSGEDLVNSNNAFRDFAFDGQTPSLIVIQKYAFPTFSISPDLGTLKIMTACYAD